MINVQYIMNRVACRTISQYYDVLGYLRTVLPEQYITKIGCTANEFVYRFYLNDFDSIQNLDFYIIYQPNSSTSRWVLCEDFSFNDFLFNKRFPTNAVHIKYNLEKSLQEYIEQCVIKQFTLFFSAEFPSEVELL